MEYRVIYAGAVHALMDQVNELIKFGWEPQGGFMKDGLSYYQAMVKK